MLMFFWGGQGTQLQRIMQGKTVLTRQEKFYLAVKYCMMGFNLKSVAAMLENNIVYFELRRKGYDVYIGKNATKGSTS